MNKVSGNLSDFAYVRNEGSRIAIGYGLKQTGESMYEWYEVYRYNKQVNQLSADDIKSAILADIDSRTDSTILNGYQWTILHGDTDKPEEERHVSETVSVWLSMENQENFKEAHRLASADASKVIPIKFKISEDEDKKAVYETFESFGELDAFYLGAFSFIKQSIDAGWAEKDSIDWKPYEDCFPQVVNE